MLGLYLLIVAVATYPMVASIRSALPSNVDPVQHLTIMRWYKACLMEGRSPFVHAGIQHPVGAPIGCFSPILLLSTAYLVLSSVISNDILCYNLLWFGGFLLTGLATFRLAYRVVGDVACAGFAGAGAMLGGPMMLHAHGHLELMYLGTFPLFLSAWMRFVDRPGWRSLAVAAGTYGMMTLGTGYFALLAVVPAGWYAAWRALDAARRRDGAWIKGRATWLFGFAALALPVAALAFSGQIWNLMHGVAMNRSRHEFELYGVPWYGYAVPTLLHRLDRLFYVEMYGSWGRPAVECASYLGMVTLALIAYAALVRVQMRQAGFWWSVTLAMIVLSFGAYAQLGPVRIPLPAGWMYELVPPFRLIRAPARFNLFATVGAAVLAAAGLKHLVGRWRSVAVRWGICSVVTAVAVLDLSMVPFGRETMAPMPGCYARVVGRDPGATFLDAPLHPSSHGDALSAAGAYWQGSHRGRTTAGYGGIPNVAFDNEVVTHSPFSADAMADPNYLADPESASFGIINGVRFLDHAWLYLTVHDLRYLVLHRPAAFAPGPEINRRRLEDLLASARVDLDDSAAVYDRDRLPRPARAVIARGRGWRGGGHGRPALIASKLAGVHAYNPDPAVELTFTVVAKAFREPRTVRLLGGDGIPLATWRVPPDLDRPFTSPPFRLPAGLQLLTVASDAEETPLHGYEAVSEVDDRPYRLFVSGISLRPDQTQTPVGR